MLAMLRVALIVGGLSLAGCAHDPSAKYGSPDVRHTTEAEPLTSDGQNLPTPPQTELVQISLYSGPEGSARLVRYEGECDGVPFTITTRYGADNRRFSPVSFDLRVNGETFDPRLNKYVEAGLNQFPVIMLDVESVWCMGLGDYQLNLFVVREHFFMPGQHLSGAGASRQQTRDPDGFEPPAGRPRPLSLAEYRVVYNMNHARRARERGETEFPIFEMYHSLTEITAESRFPARIVSLAPFAEANCFGPVLGYPFTPEGCEDGAGAEPE